MNSSDPVVLLQGGTHTIGTSDSTSNNTRNQLFRLTGDTLTGGVATDQPIKGGGASFTVNSTTANNPFGALFKATNAADIQVKKGSGDTSGGNALSLDTVLFEATLPVFELVGTSSTQTKFTTADAFVDIKKSKVLHWNH